MFTGIVEIIGTVTSLVPLDETSSGGSGTSLTISNASEILGDAHLGDSINVNGTCLTITELPASDSSSFKVGISPETLRRTNLGSLTTGSNVNLERALLPSTRLGGHFCQGHVDTIATIVEKTPDGNAVNYKLEPKDQSLLRYIVEKGYITLDGASLTITGVGGGGDGKQNGWLSVMLIAYTQEKVVMGSKGVGEEVNIEVDMVSKYVEKSVASYFEGKDTTGSTGALERMVNRIVDERLAKR